MAIQKITPFLWFDTQAEDAATLYTSIFPNSKIGKVTRYGDAGPGPAGSVMTVAFELDGLSFVALNGGPVFTFNEAVSFVVSCESQKEIDHYWEKLVAGGTPSRCGWLKDRFGVSWQITPTQLPDLLASPDPARNQRAMQAMFRMAKIDLQEIENAAKG